MEYLLFFMHVSDALSNEYSIHLRTFFETKTVIKYYCVYWSILLQKQCYVLKEIPHQFISSWSIRKGLWQKQGFRRDVSLNFYTMDRKNKCLQSSLTGFKIQGWRSLDSIWFNIFYMDRESWKPYMGPSLQNSQKLQEAKKNLEENVWFRLKRCVFVLASCVLPFSGFKGQKKTLSVFVFQVKVFQQEWENHKTLCIFLAFETKNKKNTESFWFFR